MVPAMDRSSRKLARWFWIGLGLSLVVSQPGCSELKTELFGRPQVPAEIGQRTDMTDIYAAAHRPKSVTPGGAGRDGGNTILAGSPEVVSPTQPAEKGEKVEATSVALQAPQAIASTTLGVPNASRILAAADRPTETKPILTPETLIMDARAALDGLTSYQVAMHRQENVNGTLLPEEDVILAIRREPLAVRLTWPSGPNQGREVLYRSDEPGGQMHVRLPNPALPRLSFAPDSPMVMRNSRHPVTEAGFDSLVQGLETSLKTPQSGLVYTGLETPEGFDHPLHCLARVTPSKESWKVYLDPTTHLPALVQAIDGQGVLLERYAFVDVRPNLPELAGVEAFDVNARWGQPRGLLSRLTRGDQPAEDQTPRQLP